MCVIETTISTNTDMNEWHILCVCVRVCSTVQHTATLPWILAVESLKALYGIPSFNPAMCDMTHLYV